MKKEVTLSFEMLAQPAPQSSLQHLLLNPHLPPADPQVCICSPRAEVRLKWPGINQSRCKWEQAVATSRVRLWGDAGSPWGDE